MTEEYEEEHSEAYVAVLFPFVALAFGCLARQLLLVHNAFPYSAVLLILGAILATIDYHASLGILGESISLWSDIPGELVLYAFLPALIFADTMNVNVHLFKKSFFQAILLAGPGLALGSFLTAIVGRYIFPYDWSWATSMTLGSILAATDPVAVVAMLKDLGASPNLSMLVSAESLLNDGTAVVLYALFVNIAQGVSYDAWGIIKFLLQNALAGPCIGIAFGIVLVAWLSITTDLLVEISLTVATAYLAYFTADDPCNSSGVLATVFAGITMSFVGRANITGKGKEALNHVWETIEFMGNTIIFFLSGVIIADRVLDLGSKGYIGGREWGFLFALYALVNVIRFIMLGTLFPLLYFTGYGMDWRRMTVIGWGGLRGAVGLALALAIEESTTFEDEETRALILFYVGGIVVLTLIINGPSTGLLLRLLGMQGSKVFGRELLLKDVHNYLGSKDSKNFKAAIKKLEMGDVHPDVVAEFLPHMKKYLKLSTSQKKLNSMRGHAQFSTHNKLFFRRKLTNVTDKVGTHERLDDQQQDQFLRELHLSYLNWMKVDYARMVETGSLTRDAYIILDYAIESAMDHVGDIEKACKAEWKVVEEFVGAVVPSLPHRHVSKVKAFFGQVVGFRWTSDVETGLHICLAYLHAHQHSREQVEILKDAHEKHRDHELGHGSEPPGFLENPELFAEVNSHASGLLWMFFEELMSASRTFEDLAQDYLLRVREEDPTAVDAVASLHVILHLLHEDDEAIMELRNQGFLTSSEAERMIDRNEHSRMAASRYHSIHRMVRAVDEGGTASRRDHASGSRSFLSSEAHGLHVGWLLCRGLCR